MKPLLLCLEDNQLIEGFFFIRYSEGGPHIRLRLATLTQDEAVSLKPLLCSHFEAYFGELPRSSAEESEVSARAVYSPDSVQFIDYLPEEKRYGGSNAILIAEDQFELSSRVVLSILTSRPDISYEEVLGRAIQLHLGFVAGLEFDTGEALTFYSWMNKAWLAKAAEVLDGTSNEERTRNAFELKFRELGPTLIPTVVNCWELFRTGRRFDHDYLLRWVTGMRSIGERLGKAVSSHQIISPVESLHDPQIDNDKTRLTLWPILGSYVHMTNNRLGIHSWDEAFLAYLISRCLAGVSREPI